MRIGYDAKRAAHNFTGLGNYSRYVIEHVAKNNKYDIRLYTPRKSKNSEYQALYDHGKLSESTPNSFFARRFPSLWRSFALTKEIRRDRIELFHGLSNELPFGIRRSGAKSIVTIHDLIFLRLPHCYNLFDRVIYNYKFWYACRKADMVLAISECTKRDIMNYYGIESEKISVVYQGCAGMFKKEATIEEKEEVKRVYNLPDKFILNVGTLEERKNLFLIVKGLRNLPNEIHVVAVGRKTNYSDMVMEYARIHGLSDRVHLLHKVKYTHLPAIYQNADIFAYPSHYEGFGIPIIEAISSGKAVIAATGSCLEEAGGEGAIYVDPNSVEEFTEAAKRLINDKEYRKEIVEKGKEHIKKFEDKTISEELKKLYENVINQ
ncbi:MAG: glycosyltransferase family 1 protein [Rikenellaceae bacterium]